MLDDPLEELRSHGLDFGTYLTPSGNKEEVYEIVSVSKNSAEPVCEVTLALVSSNSSSASASTTASALKTYKTVKLTDLVAGFIVAAASDVKVLHSNWLSKKPLASASYRECAGKALVQQAIVAAAQANSSQPDSLIEVLLKPSRSVRATDAIKKGSFLLIPDTFKISALANGAKESANDFVASVRSSPSGPVERFTLQSCFSDAFVAPFWSIRRTTDDKQAGGQGFAGKVGIRTYVRTCTRTCT